MPSAIRSPAPEPEVAPRVTSVRAKSEARADELEVVPFASARTPLTKTSNGLVTCDGSSIRVRSSTDYTMPKACDGEPSYSGSRARGH